MVTSTHGLIRTTIFEGEYMKKDLRCQWNTDRGIWGAVLVIITKRNHDYFLTLPDCALQEAVFTDSATRCGTQRSKVRNDGTCRKRPEGIDGSDPDIHPAKKAKEGGRRSAYTLLQ
jgi:hypothetical protein